MDENKNNQVPELTKHEFEELIKKDLVLIDFFAGWCMPCVMMTPIIEDISEKLKGKIKVGKVNIEDNQELSKKHNVSSIPSFLIFKDGKVIEQFTGSISEEELENKLNSHL